jgi:hypothetical protein
MSATASIVAPCGLEHRRDATRPVTVGVGFDDGDDGGRDRRTAAGAAIQSRFIREMRGNRPEVGFQRFQIDARGGAANHWDRLPQR